MYSDKSVLNVEASRGQETSKRSFLLLTSTFNTVGKTKGLMSKNGACSSQA